MAEPPHADKRLSPFCDLFGRRGGDHVGVVGTDLLAQPPGWVPTEGAAETALNRPSRLAPLWCVNSLVAALGIRVVSESDVVARV